MLLLRNSRGQSLIEYVILVALVGIATMGMVRTLQSTISVNLGKVTNSLQGKGEKPAYERVDAKEVSKRKDFGDFMNGAASKDE